MSDAKHALDRILAIVDRYLEDAEGIGDVPAARALANYDANTVRDALEPPTPYDYVTQIKAERGRQRFLGYDEAHDQKHGREHLIREAQIRAMHGKPIEACAILLALIDYDTRAEALAAAVAVADAAWEAYIDRSNSASLVERRALRAASAAADQEVDRLERLAREEEA